MGRRNSLQEARRSVGLSQEEVAERLGVSRQTISKWELGETMPDICQAKCLATLYHMTLDALVTFDLNQRMAEIFINSFGEDAQQEVDWTEVWAKRYPILTSYQEKVEIRPYAEALGALMDRLRDTYGYGEEDAMLVLKDILGQVWSQRSTTAHLTTSPLPDTMPEGR